MAAWNPPGNGIVGRKNYAPIALPNTWSTTVFPCILLNLLK
jgi:hypothetical protein